MIMKRNVKGFHLTRGVRKNISIFLTFVAIILIFVCVTLYFFNLSGVGLIIFGIACFQIGDWGLSISEYLHEDLKEEIVFSRELYKTNLDNDIQTIIDEEK